MATIAELVVKISARDQGLKRGLTSASKRVKAFVSRVGRNLAKLTAVVATAVLAGVALMARSLAQTSEEVDKLAKTAVKLGVATEELQKLQFQARLTGVSTETLNMALQRMVRRVSEAAQGTGEAVNALKELGIDAKNLATLSPDKQFRRVAEAMQGIANQGDKVRLAMKLFDSEGVALVNTLGSNLAQTGSEFERLGVSISGSQAKAVEAFNDAQTKLSAVWEGFKMQILTQIAPALEVLVLGIIDIVQNMGGVKAIAKDVAIAVVSSVLAMSKSFDFFTQKIQGVKVALLAVRTALTRVAAVKIRIPFTDTKIGLPIDREKLFSREDEFGRAVDQLGADSGPSKLEGILNSLKSGQEAVKSSSGAGVKGAGFGSITDPTTGRSLSTGKAPVQEIKVQIISDKNALVDAVVTSDQFNTSVERKVDTTTKEAARATRR